MTIEVRYQSRGGNTRAVAEIIADIANVTAEPIDVPLPGRTDILFLGGGVYMWDADRALLEYLQNLDAGQIGMIVPFSTTGMMTTCIKRIRSGAEKAGIRVSGKDLCLKIMMQGHAMLHRPGGNLKEDQIQEVQEFAKSVLAEAGQNSSET